MKKQFYSFLLLLALVVSASAQKAVTAPATVEAELRRNIEYLASDKLAGRRAGEPGADAAARYIADEFRKAGLSPGVTINSKAVYLQPFSYTPVMRDPNNPHAASTKGTPKSTANVVGILPGTDKLMRGEAIVIGAHYDHLGHGGQGSLEANSADIHHGADDNASGTAAIIALAREFVGQKSNKRTIIFIAFSGEEDGLFGSKYYTDNPVFPLDKTVAMINLDMVGRLHNNKLNIGGIGTAAEFRELVEGLNINQAAVIPAVSTGTMTNIKTDIPPLYLYDLALSDDGFGPSDHSSFYQKQIPVLFFFTGTHLDYHKPSDTADKINYEGEVSLIAFIAGIVRSIDASSKRPTYTVAKSSGNTGGRAGFNVSLGTIPSYGDSDDGLLIDGVREGSPADKAGLKAGDKVVRLAGRDIKNVMDYTTALGEMKPDVEYDITVKRGDDMLKLKITPAKR